MERTPPSAASRIRNAAFPLLLAAASLSAQIPNGFTFTAAFGTAGSGAFGKLAGMEEIPGKAGHFIVVELHGKITTLIPDNGGAYTRSSFATIGLDTEDDDQGLSSICFHPDFVTNRKYYIRRGALNPRRLIFEEREASSDGLKDSGKPPRAVLTVPMPEEFPDHNGGGLAFGPDGFLYIGIGDGGSDLKTPDVHGNGQNREVLLGKILRIDVNRKDPGLEYAIPADNPFVSEANAKVRREIWCWGLRNPFRMSFDKLTGELYIGDVGLDDFEKINIARKGVNFGWKLQEHTLCFIPGTCSGITVEPSAAFLPYGPVKCFVSGITWRGNPASPFHGVHIFGDHTMKRLLAFKKGTAPVQATDLQSAPGEMTSFTVDLQNNLYMTGLKGTIYKVTHPDLTPGAIAVRPAKPRPGVALSGAALHGLRWHGPADLYTLDGSRLGSLDKDGRLRGELPAAKTGLILAKPRP